ncbi:MAG: Gfo/Idh/MocA family oxidoreductase [Bryobacteraceae bacterium]
MSSRRTFLGQVATGIGGLAIPGAVLGSNDRLRFGIIGYGARGQEIVRDALSCPNTEFAGVCDIYTDQRERAKSLAPSVKTFIDHRLMLEQKDLDLVLIATPQHLHCEHFVDSIQAGKHVYLEKTMAFSVEHARRMRAIYQPLKDKQVVQIGHQACSSGHVADAESFLSGGKLGQITGIDAAMYRNTPHGKPQWSRPIKPDMTPENIVWSKFLGDAPKVPFDANRYRNWRFFWDYSGGNVYENMCHQVAFWYKVLQLQIPQTVTMRGGLFVWKDGREVPDTMSVSMVQPEDLLFTWVSSFGNASLGVTEQVLGTDGTISRGMQIRYVPEKVNRPDAEALTGQTPSVRSAHMQNFIDAIRFGNQVNCPFDLGYRVSIACRMAVESYRQGRTVRWDDSKEEIV